MTDYVFDNLLSRLGTGKWNLMFFLSLSFWELYIPSNVLSGVFLAPQVGHSCRPPAHAHLITSTTHNGDGTNTTTTDSCYYYMNKTEDGVLQEPCDAWVYDNSTFSSTLTSQFDLVCSSGYLRATYQSVYMIGSAIGTPVTGILADRFGRKRMLTLGIITYFSVGLTISWLTSFPVILVFRFVCGAVHSCIGQTGYILSMEVCEPSRRSVIGILLAFPWAVGTIIWGGLAYLLRDWHWLQRAVNLPAFICIPAVWFLDESPRWLIVNGHLERARKVLERAARWNNVDLPPAQELDHLMTTIQKESTKAKQTVKEEHNHSVNCTHKLRRPTLLRTPKLRYIFLVTCFMFFVVSMTFYGMSLNASNYSADLFIYMVITGLMEVPGYCLMGPIVGRLGRKRPIIVCLFVCGTVIVAVAFIPSDIQWLVMTLAMVGKMCISAAFQALYLYTMELLPTEVRLQGFGCATFASRIGSISSPFITEILGPLYPSAPSLVFGLGTFAAGAATLLLQETLGTSLPDTIADLENPHHRPTLRLEDDDKDTEMAILPGNGPLAK